MELLVYVPKNSSRINYIFNQICGRILGFEVHFTSKIEAFISFQGVKFSYCKKKLGNEIFIQQYGLLEEHGINDVNIMVDHWEDAECPCFFRVSNDSDLAYDIFSASFYLLSRYEEYQPHVKNEYGCFGYEESLAFQKNFLTFPVIEMWTECFKSLLKQKFDLPEQEKNYKVNLNIAVEEAYAFRHRGFVRVVGASARDFFKFDFREIYQRFKSLMRLAPDPYDIYNDLIAFGKESHITLDFYFQLSDYTRYSKSISYNKRIYHKLIKSMGDYVKLGLRPGYEAINNFLLFKKEKQRWQNIVNQNLHATLIKSDGMNFPLVFEHMNKLEITDDYSMGYPNQIGFRAGTASAFQFYDLNLEQSTRLVVHPYVFNSDVLLEASFNAVETELIRIAITLKRFGLTNRLAFTNADFSMHSDHQKLYTLLKKLS